MPEPRADLPYPPPPAGRGAVPDLSEVPAFLRERPATRPHTGPSPATRPGDRPASVRSGRQPRIVPAVPERERRPSVRDGGPTRPRPPVPASSSERSRRSAQPAPIAARPAGRSPSDAPGLPIPSLSRRRLGTLAAALAGAWLVIAFGRQVGEASAASDRVRELRLGNAALRADVAALESQLTTVTDPGYVAQAARGVRMGGPGEIPFSLAADAPSLAPDAPGSAATRLGSAGDEASPLEGWIELLLGPRG